MRCPFGSVSLGASEIIVLASEASSASLGLTFLNTLATSSNNEPRSMGAALPQGVEPSPAVARPLPSDPRAAAALARGGSCGDILRGAHEAAEITLPSMLSVRAGLRRA